MANRYNAFGLTTDEVIAAYIGSTYQDYSGTGSYDDGMTLISNEIANQEAKIVNALSPYVVKNLEYVILEEVIRTSYAGQTTFNFGLTPNISGATNFVYITADTNYIGPLFRTDIQYNDWFNQFILDDENALPDGLRVPFSYSPNGLQGILQTPLVIGQVVYATYAVNTATLNMPSLKAVLKDQVVATLGYRLFSQSDTVWGLVERYAKDADAGMAMISTDGYLPAEIKRMRWFKTPFRTDSGYSSVKLKRG